MNREESIYSVLVVSASEKFNQAASEIFTVPAFSPVQVAPSVGVAKRALSERDFDIVVINPPFAGDAGINFAIDTAETRDSVDLFLTKAEQYEENSEKLASHGIFLLQKPVSRSVFQIATGWLISAREGLKRNRKKTLSIEEKMNEIRLVNRAKWLLISELKMTEADAHRHIEKQAMDRCSPKSRIAEEIIKMYS